MLGELIGEAAGNITSIEVLPHDGTQIHFKISGQGSAKFLGHEMTLLATYHQIVRPDKTFFCPDGHVAMVTADGESLYWTGFAVGHPTGKPPMSRLAPCGHLRMDSQKLQRLNGMAAITEYVSNEDGTWTWKVWEWKVPKA